MGNGRIDTISSILCLQQEEVHLESIILLPLIYWVSASHADIIAYVDSSSSHSVSKKGSSSSLTVTGFALLSDKVIGVSIQSGS